MFSMLDQIKTVASLLGIGQGELLSLARLVTGEDVAALELMYRIEQQELMDHLCWLAKVGKSIDTEMQPR